MKIILKSLSTAVLVMGVSTGSSIAAETDVGNTGFYIGSAFAAAKSGDVDAYYRTKASTVSWSLESFKGANVEVGYDFGEFRTALKVTALAGGVDTIDGATLQGDVADMAIGTINAYWDIERYVINEQLSITPYIGLGLGAAGGYMEGQKTTDLTGIADGDHQHEIGFAVGGNLGALFEVHEHLGITANYNMVGTKIGGNTLIHVAEVGLRLTF